MVKTRVLLFVAVAAVQLLAISTASANHVEGPYEGTAATGGTVKVVVNLLDTTYVVSGINAINVPTNCGVRSYFGGYDDPISELGDHPFAHTTSPEMNYAGSFPAPGAAAGTLTWVNCGGQVITWTATFKPEETGGDKSTPDVSPAERRCRRIADKKKRKRCLRKLACRKIESKAKRKRCLGKLKRASAKSARNQVQGS